MTSLFEWNIRTKQLVYKLKSVELLTMKLESKSIREIFTVYLPGYKSEVGKFTQLFIPKWGISNQRTDV